MRRITTIYLDEAQYIQILAISQNTKIPMAALFREALDQWLERRRMGHRTTLKAFSELSPGPDLAIKTASKQGDK